MNSFFQDCSPLLQAWVGRAMLCSVESQALQSRTWDQPQPQFTQIQLWRCVGVTQQLTAALQAFLHETQWPIYHLSLAPTLQTGAKMLINTKG